MSSDRQEVRDDVIQSTEVPVCSAAGECIDQKDFIAQHPEVQKLLSEFFQDVRVIERKMHRDSLNQAFESTTGIASEKAKQALVGTNHNHLSARSSESI